MSRPTPYSYQESIPRRALEPVRTHWGPWYVTVMDHMGDVVYDGVRNTKEAAWHRACELIRLAPLGRFARYRKGGS